MHTYIDSDLNHVFTNSDLGRVSTISEEITDKRMYGDFVDWEIRKRVSSIFMEIVQISALI